MPRNLAYNQQATNRPAQESNMQPADLHRNPTCSQQTCTGIQHAASRSAQESNMQPTDQHMNPTGSQQIST